MVGVADGVADEAEAIAGLYENRRKSTKDRRVTLIIILFKFTGGINYGDFGRGRRIVRVEAGNFNLIFSGNKFNGRRKITGSV